MIVVKEEIRDLILSIKSSGNVNSMVDNGNGTFTINTDSIGNLAVNFKVVLIYSDTTLNKDVKINSLTDTSFTFTSSGLTQPVSWQMALYFEVGSRIELVKKYQNKAKSVNKYVQEYPLVWLYTGFEHTPSEMEAAEYQTTLQFALVDFSEKELYEEQRLTDSFKPVLYPILELIDSAFNGIYKRKFVTTYGKKEIELMYVDRPFFGSADKSANVLPEITDAIEFQVELHWRESIDVCTSY